MTDRPYDLVLLGATGFTGGLVAAHLAGRVGALRWAIAGRDRDRLAQVAGHKVAAPTKGNRPGCYCARAKDIGAYDTCPHGCCYCYAVQRPELAKRRYQVHDPEAEFLIAPGTKVSGA